MKAATRFGLTLAGAVAAALLCIGMPGEDDLRLIAAGVGPSVALVK